MEIRFEAPAPGECRGFVLEPGEGQGGDSVEGFVVATADGCYAYRNSCPHTGAPLNWQPDQFLNYENDMIECTLHGARFQIEDGYCLHGPCLGQSLQPLSLRREGALLVIAIAADQHNR